MTEERTEAPRRATRTGPPTPTRKRQPMPSRRPLPDFGRNSPLSLRFAAQSLAVALFVASVLVAPPAVATEEPEVDLSSTLFLTWDADPTTTMTIQWLARPGETPRVEWCAAGLDEWRPADGEFEPFGPSDWIVCRVRLTELEPNADYLFRRAGRAERRRFRTAPATADSLRFVAGGDAGPYPATAETCRAAARYAPTFGLLGGDLAYANGHDATRWVEFLGHWCREMVAPDGTTIPLVVTIGNHEVDKRIGATRDAAPYFYSLFRLFREQGHAVLDFGESVSLFLLDSGHTTPIAGEQTDWLEQSLAARKGRPHLFAAYHVPAYPSYRSLDGGVAPEIRSHWVPLFDRFGLDVAFENNDHTYKRTPRMRGGARHPEGVLYLGDGCWGVMPRHVKDDRFHAELDRTFSDHHFILTELAGVARHHRVFDASGRWRDSYPMPEFALHVDTLEALSVRPTVIATESTPLLVTVRTRATTGRIADLRVRVRSPGATRDLSPTPRSLTRLGDGAARQTVHEFELESLDLGVVSFSVVGWVEDAFGRRWFETGGLETIHGVDPSPRAPSDGRDLPTGGLRYRTAVGRFAELPDFETLDPVGEGVAAPRDWHRVRPADDDFVIEFTGSFRASKTGLYRFRIRSDDGSRLSIGGRVVVDNDGRRHEARSREGWIHLAAGWHPCRLGLFARGGVAEMSVFLTPPGEDERRSTGADWSPSTAERR